MLSVTVAAAEAINALVAEHEMPPGSGLRIYREGDSTRSQGLGLSIVAAPADDDTVIEENGARVFLPPYLVGLLKNEELHVEPPEVADDAKPNFTIDRKRKPNGHS